MVSLTGLTTLVSQVKEPSSALMQSASILLWPWRYPVPRSHPSVCAWAEAAPNTDIINRTEALRR